MGLTEFIESRLKIVEALAAGQLGAGYLEACLLSSGIWSGLASLVWPGRGQDHARFVEVAVAYSDPAFQAARVSAPLLWAMLSREGRVAPCRSLEGLRPSMLGELNADRLVTGDDVDLSETEVLSACPELNLSDVRPFAYASIFYEEVRCFVAHQYQLGERVTDFVWRPEAERISYENRMAGSQHAAFHVTRLIHFPVRWVVGLVRSMAVGLGDRSPREASPAPEKWWLQGGSGRGGTC